MLLHTQLHCLEGRRPPWQTPWFDPRSRWNSALRHGRRFRLWRENAVTASSLVRQPSKEWVLAIDVGTGGTKVALASCFGNVSASAFAPHHAPSAASGLPASMEQDPEDWWSAVKLAVRSCLEHPAAITQGIGAAQLGCVAVTGQMQDVILLPQQSGVSTKRDAILYSDARAELEAFEIASLAGGAGRVSSITGFPQGASSVLAKLRWLDKHDPQAAQLCQSLLLGGHDFVVWKLCGRCVTDATTASTTGLTDQTFQYAEDLLVDVKLGHWKRTLPQVHPSDIPCGEVSRSAAAELGFPLQGLPVLHACGDAGASSFGAGAGVEGSLYAYLGTSGWVAGSFSQAAVSAITSEPSPSGVFTLGHPEPSLVFRTGSILNAGNNLQWAASNLSSSSGQAWNEVNRLAASAPAGCGGLLYFPYLNGERCPFDDPHVRACFLGISATTSQAHLLRAVMEGVAFAMRSGRDAMMGGKPTAGPLRLVGGGARSPVWPAIMAGVFGQTVEVLEDAQDVGVKGAAMLAAKWLGWQPVESSDGTWIRVQASFPPTEQDIYEQLYRTYAETSASLRGVFKRMSTIKGLYSKDRL